MISRSVIWLGLSWEDGDVCFRLSGCLVGDFNRVKIIKLPVVHYNKLSLWRLGFHHRRLKCVKVASERKRRQNYFLSLLHYYCWGFASSLKRMRGRCLGEKEGGKWSRYIADWTHLHKQSVRMLMFNIQIRMKKSINAPLTVYTLYKISGAFTDINAALCITEFNQWFAHPVSTKF